ncbi:MAG: hypothetical protein E6Q76_08175 [Rhizobium sp.]|nr:MAG: hypothetical protein E6Q76_08175 [Rhizobium sp.]
MSTPRLRRLVLIDSGKISYANLELNRCAHLWGANNLGKTSVVSALRFLLCENVRDMGFDKSVEETKAYYFRSPYSTILFECETHRGKIVTLGVRSKPRLAKADFIRFIYQGVYRDDDFLDPETDQALAFDDVQLRLSGKRYRQLAEGDLYGILTGDARDDFADLSIGLVPLREIGDYRRFLVLFKHLLGLSDLDQNSLKQTLISINRGRLKTPASGFDLKGEASDFFDQEEVFRRQITSLEAMAGRVERMREARNVSRAHRVALPSIHARLESLRAQGIASCNAVIDTAREELTRAEQKLLDYTNREQNTEKAKADVVASLARERTRISEHEADAKAHGWETYLPEFADQTILTLGAQIDALTLRLSGAQRASPEALKSRIEATEKQLKLNRSRLDNLAHLFGTRLSQTVSAETLSKAFAVLNPALLGLRMDSEIQVADDRALHQTLGAAADAAAGGFSHVTGVAVAAGAVEGADLKSYLDLSTIQAAVGEAEDLLRDLRPQLEDAERVNKLVEERAALILEHEKASGQRTLFRRWDGLRIKELPGWIRSAEQLLSQEGTLGKQLGAERRASNDQRSRIDEIKGKLKAHESRLNDWYAAKYPNADVAWLSLSGGVPDHASDPQDFWALKDHYLERFTTMESAQRSFLLELGELRRLTLGQYDGESDDETADKLIEQIANLEQLRSAHEDIIRDIVSHVRGRVQGMLADLGTLQHEVAAFAKALKKTPISDLQSVSITLVPFNSERLKLEGMLAAADEQNLFAEGGRRAVADMKDRIIQNPRFDLADLFAIEFPVQTVDGRVTVLTDIARVQSTGTTIGIKVLICLNLLKEFLQPGKPISLPMFIDEVASVDIENLTRVTQRASELGFVTILASPLPMPIGADLYQIQDGPDGRSVVLGESRIQRELAPDETASA